MTASYIITRPPSANRLFRNLTGKGRVRTSEYNTWLKDAGWELKQFRRASHDCPVRVRIHAQRTMTKTGKWSLVDGDCDNLIKPVLDLLVKNHVVPDDNAAHVHGVSVDWVIDISLNARQVRVTVEPVEQTKVGKNAHRSPIESPETSPSRNGAN